jgi:hypothetical protein
MTIYAQKHNTSVPHKNVLLQRRIKSFIIFKRETKWAYACLLPILDLKPIFGL